MRLHVDVEDGVERFDVAPQRILIEDRTRGFVRAHDVGRRRTGLLAEPEREGRPGAVHDTVHERGRRDLAAQSVSTNALEERSPHRRRKGAHELGHEVVVVGEVRREQLLFE